MVTAQAAAEIKCPMASQMPASTNQMMLPTVPACSQPRESVRGLKGLLYFILSMEMPV